MTDDPGRKKVIVRRGVKHAECIKDTSKSSTSVMFSGTASGIVLPIYVVYKADHLYDSWTLDGPKGTRYNRSKSGWFDTTIFEDWFLSVVIPYFRRFKDQKKVMIGDNLASHISKRVIETCQSNNISFVLLPPNSTHLCQPLDVAFFRPLKYKWKQQLDLWKDNNKGVLQKNQFPRLLNKVMKELGDNAGNNLKAGFEACGIVPFNPQNVLKRIPQRTTSSGNSWLESFEEHLENKRSNETSLRIKKKRLTVPPGRSVAELVETNVEHEDIDGDIEVIFDCDNVIQPDSDAENVSEQNNPILIIVPPDDQLPSSSGTQVINLEKEDNIEDITLSLKVNDFIQFYERI
ncbi:uncharacterized protein LOC126554147 [Aphis gossypii]|uniref:uncharacterized protein LOC126554147 n=1 Tax=Aphis gossypii TaxID=80765 RepID=UPI002158D30F|nr:uncharacterized protein LOC126554147 [Aphis gossypii]